MTIVIQTLRRFFPRLFDFSLNPATVPSGFRWWSIGVGCLAVTELAAAVVIHEIHYDPDVKIERVEFIELFNSGAEVVELDGWQLTGAVDFEFPAGTTLAADGFVVVTEDPTAFDRKFAAPALGPWTGVLSNEGETIILRDASGAVVDRVDYRLGFPWPTVGESPGYSIELVHPDLENDLGGSWRRSVRGEVSATVQNLIAAGEVWRFFPGTREASSPRDAWRTLEFNDAGWDSGRTPIGYGEGFIRTSLAMRDNYTGVFFRKEFEVEDPAAISQLTVEVQFDDGFILWVNGRFLLSENMPSNEVAFNRSASSAIENTAFVSFDVDVPRGVLVPGANVIAVQAHNASIGGSSDFFFDLRLSSRIGPASRGPTPGTVNAAAEGLDSVPPQVRQVDHEPKAPRSGEPVRITVKATDPDGVSSVDLLYQVVDPGRYIELTDPDYSNGWVRISMNDEGRAGDRFAGDSIFTGVIPENVQRHRRLVRYRLEAEDTIGNRVRAPYADDPQPNFAYFVYDGVPSWQGRVRPGTVQKTFADEEMNRLPVYHLISKRESVEASTWRDKYTGDEYRWTGTLVYNGEVYDHIRYRARGGVWRYAMGKNMWKFDFLRGHDFVARDQYDRKYNVGWTKLNLGACIQQGNFDHRGEQGMFEAVGFRLFNMAGVEAPRTHWVQFRVVDETEETFGADQYRGDFWGLYLAVEQMNGRFLDEHGLPDGNLYKMEGGSGDANNIGRFGPANKTDLNTFLSTYRGSSPSDDWWRQNLDLRRYFSYQAIVHGIHHYDICYGKNYFYFLNPDSARWSVLPWDLDLTWAENMYDHGCGGVDDLTNRVLNRAAFRVENQNRIREILDLLFNDDQAFQVIEEYAWLAQGPAGPDSFLEADRAMWDYNPLMRDSSIVNLSKAGHGRFYQFPRERQTDSSLHGSFDVVPRIMKNYVSFRGRLLEGRARDPRIPLTPTVTALAPAGFPANALAFRTGIYRGNQAFRAVEWRIGEVRSPGIGTDYPGTPGIYEIEPVWASPEIETPGGESDILVPASAVEVGRDYRVRARFTDVTGRKSHWSDPVQFTVGQPDNAVALVRHVAISELMYHAPGGPDFDFLELRNRSEIESVDLSQARFTDGISYEFPVGTVLGPGEFVVLIKHPDPDVFAAYYGLDDSVAVRFLGPFEGNLNNDGERLSLLTAGGGEEIFSFRFADGGGWPAAADGAGHSLVPLERVYAGQNSMNHREMLDYAGNWRASAWINGSPGVADPIPEMGLRLNEIAAHTDFDDARFPEFDSNDWIEIANAGGADVDFSDYFLSDDPAQLRKWAVPAGRLAASERISFDEVTGFHRPIDAGFGLNKAGEAVFLSHIPNAAGRPSRVVDAVRFGGQGSATSWGRFPDTTGSWQRMAQTRDAENTSPVRPLVITEIMYHPRDPGSIVDPDESFVDTAAEFVEIWNGGDEPVDLFGEPGLATGTWRLSGGIQYLPAGALVLNPDAYLIVVPFDPADTALRNRFIDRYAAEASVLLAGPYSGVLDNRTDEVLLERSQPPDRTGDPVVWETVDDVVYADRQPWPTVADGLGASLQRRHMDRAGGDPDAWVAATPSPGGPANDVGTDVDTDADGMPDAWEFAHGLDALNALDAEQDLDRDGIANLDEYRTGTDPADPESRLRFHAISFDDLTGPVLEFESQPGIPYRIEFRNGAASGDWSVLEEFPAAEEGGMVEVQDGNGGDLDARFYRLTSPGR